MAKSKSNAQANLLKFRGKSFSSSQTSGDGEAPEPKFLTTDTSLGHVVMMIVLRICRYITVDIKMEKRVLAIFAFIVMGGILCDHAQIVCRALMPIRTAKDSILNQYFVKIGWFWTIVLTCPFIAMTSAVMSGFMTREQAISRSRNPEPKREETTSDKVKAVLSHLLSRNMCRMIVNTLVWYFTIHGFLSIEKSWGTCTGASTSSPEVCLKSGGKWSGFDISGHTFLLLFSTLLMLEEISVMVGWEPFGHHLNAQNQQYVKSLKIGSSRQFLLFDKWALAIRLNFILITILTVIWQFMLIQTVLFYHTMMQKAVAGLWAAVCWTLLYKFFYRIDLFIRPPSKPYMET